MLVIMIVVVAAVAAPGRKDSTRKSRFEQASHFSVNVVDVAVVDVVVVFLSERIVAVPPVVLAVFVVPVIEESSLPARNSAKKLLEVVLVLFGIETGGVVVLVGVAAFFLGVAGFGRNEGKGKGRRVVLSKESLAFPLFCFVIFFSLVEIVQLFADLVPHVSLEPGTKPRRGWCRLAFVVAIVVFVPIFLSPVLVGRRWRHY
mmetsp:Transcript_3426/g.7795  ORF Transcript_3426/g.7795 Transcript_3426/m.7795 type:complete len:202 (+) Transcript_3426:212-817(+)